jgi:predicted DNA-binding transcriptional regulator AlpA
MTAAIKPDDTAPGPLIDYDGLAARGITYGRNHLRRLWEREDDPFPQPIKLSERKLAWIAKEVDDWIAKRIGEREPGIVKSKYLEATREAGAKGGLAMKRKALARRARKRRAK